MEYIDKKISVKFYRKPASLSYNCRRVVMWPVWGVGAPLTITTTVGIDERGCGDEWKLCFCSMLLWTLISPIKYNFLNYFNNKTANNDSRRITVLVGKIAWTIWEQQPAPGNPSDPCGAAGACCCREVWRPGRAHLCPWETDYNSKQDVGPRVGGTCHVQSHAWGVLLPLEVNSVLMGKARDERKPWKLRRGSVPWTC